MWSYLKEHFKRKQWTNRKIAFVSVLIATSVAFVVVFTNIMAIATIPSFKLMAGGLPIKLTGYIFGPLIGWLTGVLSDLLSFAMRPSFYHWYYTIAWGLAGFVPGIFGMFMNRNKRKAIKVEGEEKYSNANFIVTIIVLSLVFITMFLVIYLLPESSFSTSMVKSRILFMVVALAGSASMLIAVIIFRFVSIPRFKKKESGRGLRYDGSRKLKPNTLNELLPIISFSALLEVVSLPILTLGDQSSLFGHTDFLTNYTAHLLLSPIKIWGNMIVISFAYKIVSPLIYNKTNNGFNDL